MAAKTCEIQASSTSNPDLFKISVQGLDPRLKSQLLQILMKFQKCLTTYYLNNFLSREEFLSFILKVIDTVREENKDNASNILITRQATLCIQRLILLLEHRKEEKQTVHKDGQLKKVPKLREIVLRFVHIKRCYEEKASRDGSEPPQLYLNVPAEYR